MTCFLAPFICSIPRPIYVTTLTLQALRLFPMKPSTSNSNPSHNYVALPSQPAIGRPRQRLSLVAATLLVSVEDLEHPQEP